MQHTEVTTGQPTVTRTGFWILPSIFTSFF